jgi:hypothetical protein
MEVKATKLKISRLCPLTAYDFLGVAMLESWTRSCRTSRFRKLLIEAGDDGPTIMMMMPAR